MLRDMSVKMGSGGMRRSCQNGLPGIDRGNHRWSPKRPPDLVCGGVQLAGDV